MPADIGSSIATLHSFPVYFATIILFIGLVSGVKMASDSIERLKPYPAMRTLLALVLTVFLTPNAMDWTAAYAYIPADFVEKWADSGRAVAALIIIQLLSAVFSFGAGLTAGYSARLFGHLSRKRQPAENNNNNDKQ